jgi:hypothetical protein
MMEPFVNLIGAPLSVNWSERLHCHLRIRISLEQACGAQEMDLALGSKAGTLSIQSCPFVLVNGHNTCPPILQLSVPLSLPLGTL